jgi:conjugal transfer pilus assembly protein TraL
MSSPVNYRIVKHLDEPQRFLSLTIDEVVIAMLGSMLMVATAHKLLAGLFCAGLYSGLKYLKQGETPRYLLVLLYWYAPKEVSQLIVSKLPASHYRIWIG